MNISNISVISSSFSLKKVYKNVSLKFHFVKMTDTKQITAMLKQLGWGSGFRLPISNEENRQLEQLLDQKQSKLVSLNLELQEVSLAVDNSTKFMKNLKAKIKHAKDVEAAKRSQMENESHFLSLANRDHAKTEQELRNMDKRLKKIKERNKHLEANVLRRKDALGELVDIINFDKKAITAYEEKFSKEDAYIKLIEDFADIDNEKLKKCKEDYQHLGENIANSRVHLDQTVSETEIMEGELEELAKRFRKAHAERNQLIENWKKTLEVLEDRDEEIMDISNDYQTAALKMKKKVGMIERQEAFYENIQVQSRCYANELRGLERNMSLWHGRKKEAESEIEDNSDAISELITYITATDKEIKRTQEKLKDMNGEADEWKAKIIELKEEVDNLKAEFDVVTMESLTSAEQTNQLQDLLDKEEKKAETMTKELSRQIGWKSQRENQTKDIAQQIMIAKSEAKNLKAAITRTRKQCVETGDYLFKSQAAEYRLDLKVMNLQVKVQGLENPKSLYSKEDFADQKLQVMRLQETCDTQLQTQKQIKAQISHCEHVAVVCQKELQKETELFQNFEVKVHKLDTEIKRITKENEMFMEEIKDQGVNNSLLQVQLHRMLQSIKGYELKMFDLEQHKLTMQSAVKERKKEIEIYMSLLLNKKRSLQDEAQKLKLKCYEVSNDVQARRRKYEMVMGQMWMGTDKDEQSEKRENGKDEGRSEAYYIIKLAQERENYRVEGDKWDARVKEAEKVVEGLQNTLALMMGTNEAFKDSLKPATDNTDEAQQLRELRQKELDAVRNLKFMKDERARYSHLLRQKQFDLDKLVSHRAEYEQEILEKQYELQGIILEINGQKEKIQRATQQANKLVRELSKLEALDVELLQNDLRLRVTKEKFEFAVLTLEKLLQMHPNLVGDTVEFLHSKGMESLATRVTRKLISPSLTSTPHQSGRSTPVSSVVGRRSSNKSSIRLPSTSGRTQSMMLQKRSTQKSVVFETLTSSPSAKKLLENISKGIQSHRQSHSQIIGGSKAPRQTVASGMTNEAPGGAGAISFGELRKALQAAVAEQKKTTGKPSSLDADKRASKDSKRLKSEDNNRQFGSNVEAGGSVADVLMVVDNREKFDEAAHDADDHH